MSFFMNIPKTDERYFAFKAAVLKSGALQVENSILKHKIDSVKQLDAEAHVRRLSSMLRRERQINKVILDENKRLLDLIYEAADKAPSCRKKRKLSDEFI